MYCGKNNSRERDRRSYAAFEGVLILKYYTLRNTFPAEISCFHDYSQ